VALGGVGEFSNDCTQKLENSYVLLVEKHFSEIRFFKGNISSFNDQAEYWLAIPTFINYQE
jgi:hypothetical protein